MKLLKDFRFYLLLLLAIVSIYLLNKTLIFSFPTNYYFIAGAILALILVILGLLAFNKHKWIKIVGISLSIILVAIFGYSASVVDNVYDALVKFEENAKQKSKLEYSLIINGIYGEEETIPSLDDYKNAKFAVLELGNTSYNHEVVEMVREELGVKVQFESIKSIEDALAKMNNGEIDVLVINESIRYLIDFDLKEYTTVIKTYEFESEKVVEASNAKVTEEAFLVYLTGIDTYGDLDYVSRSDVNKIMVVNPLSKDILLVDIPRDYYVPLTCYYDEYDKLTHTGMYGPSCTVETVERYFDIDINYYARVNFSSIIEIIDALGGIDVDVKESFDVSEYHYEQGIMHMDGAMALRFARERYSFEEGDQERIRNQSLVVEAIINKVLSPSILNNYADVLDVVSANVETNMPTSDIMALIQMQLKDNAKWTIDTYTCVGEEDYAYSAMMGRDLYMRIPIEESVNKAKELISEYLGRIY